MIAALTHNSLRQFRAHRLRTAMTVLSIALGVAACFAIDTANRALLDSLSITVQRLAGNATLQITAGESGVPEALLDTVRQTPGVQLAEPVIEVVAHTGFPNDSGLLVLGIDNSSDSRLRQFEFDRSQTEIADIVGCSVATVKTRVFYAKRRLRDELARAVAMEELA